MAKSAVAYTGAGLSASSGLADYATKARETLAARPHVSSQRGSGFLASPNVGHHVLAKLHAAKLLPHVINQNHDGLLQKAGFPQHALNEIHGGFFDPSNPGGNVLRDDLYADLLRWEKTADLCLALGTSLSGLNADRICTSVAKRGRKTGLGLVIVSLQATQLDEISSVRIWCPLDEVMRMLASELSLPFSGSESTPVDRFNGSDIPVDQKWDEDGEEEHSKTDTFCLPYDPDTGVKRADAATAGGLALDLSKGAKIRVTQGNFEGCDGVVCGRNSQGHFKLKVFQPVEGLEGVVIANDHLLGSWWLAEASKGLIARLPVVQASKDGRGRTKGPA